MSIRLEGDERLIRTLRDPDLIAAPTQGMLKRVGTSAQKVAQRGAPGSIARSIQSDVKSMSVEVFSTNPRAVPIEYGRRAGAPLPPIGAVRLWMQRRGIQGSPFVLARAIARRGVRGRFFMRAAQQHVQQSLSREADELGRDVEKRFNA